MLVLNGCTGAAGLGFATFEGETIKDENAKGNNQVNKGKRIIKAYMFASH